MVSALAIEAPPARPRLAPAVVHRPRLTRALCDPDGPAVVTLVAPAGYGKTTLLSEWSERDPRPFAWLTLDERDNDPGRLLAATRLATANVPSAGEPFVLVLDAVHVLHHRLAIATLGWIARDLPPNATLAVAGRAQPGLPIARLRAEHGVTELGPRELAMTRGEALALLRASGHDVPRDAVDALVQRTEGWPVALALAAVFAGERGAQAVDRFGGTDQLVLDYVRDELLAGLEPDVRELVLAAAVADTLSGPLCDALLERGGTGSELATLAHAGLVVPLDRAEERFRFQRFLREALRAELRRTQPERERALHRRASAWHQQDGDTDLAIEHALQAGDVAAAAGLVWAGLGAAVAQCRTSTVERWLAHFEPDEIAAHARLALVAAGCALVRGRGDLAAHWTAAAAARAGEPPRIAAPIAAVIGAALELDAGASRRDAPACADPSDPAAWRAFCGLLRGMALHGEGDAVSAAVVLEDAARYAAVPAPAVHALCLAELAALAAEDDDWERAAALVTRARAQVDRHGLGDHATMALVFAVSAVVQAHRGRVDDARSDLRDAARLQALLTDFAPSTEATLRILVARAALRLSEVDLGREQLRGAERLLRRLPEAVALHEAAATVAGQLDAFAAPDGCPAASMTSAELRILQYLPTHLSFREIGELTYVSANTVKTQANAVYRKLGVSCRSEAVTRARGCGLLGSA